MNLIVPNSKYVPGTASPYLADEVAYLQEKIDTVITETLSIEAPSVENEVHHLLALKSRVVKADRKDHLLLKAYDVMFNNDFKVRNSTEVHSRLVLISDVTVLGNAGMYTSEWLHAMRSFPYKEEDGQPGETAFIMNLWTPAIGDFSLKRDAESNEAWVKIGDFSYYLGTSLSDTDFFSGVRTYGNLMRKTSNSNRLPENLFTTDEGYSNRFFSFLSAALFAKTTKDLLDIPAPIELRPTPRRVASETIIYDINNKAPGTLYTMTSSAQFKDILDYYNKPEYTEGNVYLVYGDEIIGIITGTGNGILLLFENSLGRGNAHRINIATELDLASGKRLDQLHYLYNGINHSDNVSYFYEFYNGVCARNDMARLKFSKWMVHFEVSKVLTRGVIRSYLQRRVSNLENALRTTAAELETYKEGLIRTSRRLPQLLTEKEEAVKQYDLGVTAWEERIQEILEVPDVAEVFLTTEEGEDKPLLNVITGKIIAKVPLKDGKVSTRYFGKYLFTLGIETGDLRIYQKEAGMCRKGYWTSQDPHPHVSGDDNRGCLGNLEELISFSLGNEEYISAVYAIMEYLKTANYRDSAGKLYVNWPVCDDSGKILKDEPEASERCTRCGHVPDEDDGEELATCDSCGSPHCEGCLTEVHSTDEVKDLCEHCRDREAWYCDACGGYHLQSDQDRVLTYCAHCGGSICEREAVTVSYEDADKEAVIAYVCSDNCRNEFLEDYLKCCEKCGTLIHSDVEGDLCAACSAIAEAEAEEDSEEEGFSICEECGMRVHEDEVSANDGRCPTCGSNQWV